MMPEEMRVQLILPDDFDDRAGSEAYSKGYLSASVKTETGQTFPVYFIDPYRMTQDLAAEAELGRPYIAEPGLILVPEIRIPAIEKVVSEIARDGFFERFQPLDLTTVNHE